MSRVSVHQETWDVYSVECKAVRIFSAVPGSGDAGAGVTADVALSPAPCCCACTEVDAAAKVAARFPIRRVHSDLVCGVGILFDF